MLLAAILLGLAALIVILVNLPISFIANVSFQKDGFHAEISVVLAHVIKLFGWNLREGGLSFLAKKKDVPEGKEKKKKRLNKIIEEIFNPRAILNMKKIRIFKFEINGRIASKDAALTALTYGGVCSLVAIVVPFLDQQKTHINFYPDFQETHPDFHISCIIRVRIIHIIYLIVDGLSDKYLKGRWQSHGTASY